MALSESEKQIVTVNNPLDYVGLHIKIEKNLRDNLKVKAAIKNMKMKDLVVELISKYIDKS